MTRREVETSTLGPLPEATPTESDRRILPDSAGFGPIWSDSAGFGRIWSDLVEAVGFGRIWSDSVGFGRSSFWEGGPPHSF